MRTRRGASYSGLVPRMCSLAKTNKDLHMHMHMHMHMHVRTGDSLMHIHSRKRLKKTPEKPAGDYDFFDSLPDDLVISIFCKLSSTAASPSDFVNVLITCKRLNRLGLHSLVLSKASPRTFSVRAKDWCDSAHRFLKHCADAGNVEACYTLGMIRFYCLQNRGSGASLMAKAAINSHARALYSLAVIQFNGSGGTKSDKDLRAGVALCARAAFLGHVDALRELGHCLQDGYGVRQNISEGRRFLVQANARELAAVMSTGAAARHWLTLCSHAGCGRPETRKHEFRRCSVCGAVNYCSRACQALDWKFRHKKECAPVERWLDEDGEDVGGGDDSDGEVMVDS
uniref:F-box protein At1g67340 family n=1 Tax=Cajanus cajan TaxID=3821 RepID=A0A151SDP2_CAJCA|nr:F-box protein At1g67340 family [Cajanus cajan]